MDAVIAQKTWRTLEPIHGMIYFAPAAAERYAAAGLQDPAAGYFASRAAPLGPVGANVVIATFFNFNPAMVRAVIPDAWADASPEALLAARLAAADDTLRPLADQSMEPDGLHEAAALARQAAMAACEHIEGRPLFAAHASLGWPDDPLLVLWHAQTLLREFRGDGHIAALVAEGVSGIEALVLHGATGEVPPGILRATRQWDDDAWAAACSGLVDRGWLDEAGAFTEAGHDHRARVEALTDQLALAAYDGLGEDACARLRALCRPLSKAIIAGGGIAGLSST